MFPFYGAFVLIPHTCEVCFTTASLNQLQLYHWFTGQCECTFTDYWLSRLELPAAAETLRTTRLPWSYRPCPRPRCTPGSGTSAGRSRTTHPWRHAPSTPDPPPEVTHCLDLVYWVRPFDKVSVYWQHGVVLKGSRIRSSFFIHDGTFEKGGFFLSSSKNGILAGSDSTKVIKKNNNNKLKMVGDLRRRRFC